MWMASLVCLAWSGVSTPGLLIGWQKGAHSVAQELLAGALLLLQLDLDHLKGGHNHQCFCDARRKTSAGATNV